MKYRVSVNNRTFDVALLERGADSVRFAIGEREYSVSLAPIAQNLSGPNESLGNRPNAAQAPVMKTKSRAGAGQVVAPMPGTIVSVAVNVGQVVSRGETILVMEAMKMENNITASGGGMVKEVLIKPGQQVEGGQLLVLLE